MSKSQGQRRRAAEGRGDAGRRDPPAMGRRTDYSGELSISDEILKRVVEELSPHPQHAALPDGEHGRLRSGTRCGARRPSCSEIDRYALAQARAMADAVRRAITRATNSTSSCSGSRPICSEDLGGFYLDVLKDRLYTAAREALARRSAQTALALIRDALLKLMAPILSFTAEEAWQDPAPGAIRRIFVAHVGRSIAALPGRRRAGARWERILARARAGAKGARGGASGGRDRLVAAGGGRHRGRRRDYAALASLGDDLRFVLITSAARVSACADDARRSPSRRARIRSASAAGIGAADVGADPAHPAFAAAASPTCSAPGEARRRIACAYGEPT